MKVSIRNYTCTIRPSVHLEKDLFYHGYIYRISVCFIFQYTMKVSILNYTCTTRPSVHFEIDHFFVMVIYTGFPVFFVFPCTVKVSIRNFACTIYKTKCSYILKLIIFYHGYVYRISVCFVFPSTVKVSTRNYTRTTTPSVHLEIDHFFIMVMYTEFLYVLYFHIQ